MSQDMFMTKTTPEPAFVRINAELASYVGDDARGAEITTQEEAEYASSILQAIKRYREQLQVAQDHMTLDFVNGIEKIKDLFRPAFQLAFEGEQLWKGKLLASQKARQEAASRALAEAQQAAQAGETTKATAALARAQPVERPAGVQVRKVWKFKVTDAKKVPEEFKKVDEVALRKRMNEQLKAGEAPSIKGVEFYQEETVAVVGG